MSLLLLLYNTNFLKTKNNSLLLKFSSIYKISPVSVSEERWANLVREEESVVLAYLVSKYLYYCIMYYVAGYRRVHVGLHRVRVPVPDGVRPRQHRHGGHCRHRSVTLSQLS